MHARSATLDDMAHGTLLLFTESWPRLKRGVQLATFHLVIVCRAHGCLPVDHLPLKLLHFLGGVTHLVPALELDSPQIAFHGSSRVFRCERGRR